MSDSKNLGTEILISFHVKSGNLEGAQSEAQSVGRELREDELRTIRGKCSSLGKTDDVITCTLLLGEKINDSLLENVEDVMEKFRIVKALPNREKARELIAGYILELMEDNRECDAKKLAQYLNRFDKNIVPVDFGNGPINMRIIRSDDVEVFELNGRKENEWFKNNNPSTIMNFCVKGQVRVRASLGSWYKVRAFMLCEKCNTGVSIETQKYYHCSKCNDRMRLTFVVVE